jgi:hypothetical protein
LTCSDDFPSGTACLVQNPLQHPPITPIPRPSRAATSTSSARDRRHQGHLTRPDQRSDPRTWRSVAEFSDPQPHRRARPPSRELARLRAC